MVFTSVVDAFNPMARPFNVVNVTLPDVENVTPDEAMMVPTITPPPVPLIVAALPTYQYTFFAEAPLINITLRAPAGPAIPTVSAAAV